jgi:preprotein translocase subunit SecA
MFEAMMRVMQQDVVEKVFSVQVRREQDVAQIQQQQQAPKKVMMSHGDEPVDHGGAATVKREADKVGRNDACPCGSGRKYKRCHGK